MQLIMAGEVDKEFITADGGFYWNNENYQEQEAYKLILGEIITALNIQKKMELCIKKYLIFLQILQLN